MLDLMVAHFLRTIRVGLDNWPRPTISMGHTARMYKR